MLSLLTPGESGDRLRLPFCVAGTAPVVVYRIQVELHLCPQTVQRKSRETLEERLGEKGGGKYFFILKEFSLPTSRLLWEEHKKNCSVLLKTVCHSWELFHWTLLRSWLLAAAKHPSPLSLLTMCRWIVQNHIINIIVEQRASLVLHIVSLMKINPYPTNIFTYILDQKKKVQF